MTLRNWLKELFILFFIDARPPRTQTWAIIDKTPDTEETFNFLALLKEPGYEKFLAYWRSIQPARNEIYAPMSSLWCDRHEAIQMAWYWYLRQKILVPILDGNNPHHEDIRKWHAQKCAAAGMTRTEYETLNWFPLSNADSPGAVMIYEFEAEALERVGRRAPRFFHIFYNA